ncbi:MAG TPA: YceI family protein [Flavobacteriales bacterium]|nr:YceI family protein [Flavobacteriales bacterium]
MNTSTVPKCQCGKTKDPNGNCDGSHANKYKSLKNVALSIAVIFIGLTFQNFTSFKKNVVDVKTSSIQWKAEKVVGSHEGEISLKSGELIYDDGNLVGGSFTIDMNSLICTDLSGEYKGKLEGHLKSEDFFNVETFSTASLVIKNVQKNNSNKHTITADLTIKGITKSIVFESVVEKNKLTAKIQIDRTQFNVKYGSGSFFDGLGDNMIYDEFDLTINLMI